jgi:hypothetical protein
MGTREQGWVQFVRRPKRAMVVAILSVGETDRHTERAGVRVRDGAS